MCGVHCSLYVVFQVSNWSVYIYQRFDGVKWPGRPVGIGCNWTVCMSTMGNMGTVTWRNTRINNRLSHFVDTWFRFYVKYLQLPFCFKRCIFPVNVVILVAYKLMSFSSYLLVSCESHWCSTRLLVHIFPTAVAEKGALKFASYNFYAWTGVYLLQNFVLVGVSVVLSFSSTRHHVSLFQ